MKRMLAIGLTLLSLAVHGVYLLSHDDSSGSYRSHGGSSGGFGGWSGGHK